MSCLRVTTMPQRWPLPEPELASSERSLVVSNFQLAERNYGDYGERWLLRVSAAVVFIQVAVNVG
jgi:hypothetical protein